MFTAMGTKRTKVGSNTWSVTGTEAGFKALTLVGTRLGNHEGTNQVNERQN